MITRLLLLLRLHTVVGDGSRMKVQPDGRGRWSSGMVAAGRWHSVPCCGCWWRGGSSSICGSGCIIVVVMRRRSEPGGHGYTGLGGDQ